MLLTTPSSLYNAFVNKKLEVMSNNSSRKSGHLSPPYSPNNNSANCDRKRVAEAASLPANAQAEQQPNKRPYSPSSRREDTQHNLQWRSNLMSASLLGASQDAHNRLNEYHNTLLANSLANRQAEQLFQRQLLSHYLAPQLRINSLSAFATNPAALGIASFSSRGGGQVPASSQSLASLLSLRQSNDAFAGTAARFPDASFTQGGAQAINISPLQQQVTLSTLPQESSRQQQQEEEIASIGEAAASITGQGQKFSQEKSIPLGIDEDCCWLSDFHVFVRKNLVELCWASNEDVALRSASNRVSSHQVGIRCKCCAHLSPSARAQRSSAFPSSVSALLFSLIA